MKIAVVGCGAVGSYYGAKLFRAGYDVTFLLRSDYETVKNQGLFVKSVEGDFQIRPKVANKPEQIGHCDLVLIALKTTANYMFGQLLPPLVSKNTLIMTLQNGLGNEEKLAELFGEQNILGGLCFVCLNRIQPGIIHHIAHGKIVMGEFKRPPLERTHKIAEMFRNSGIECMVSENLEKAHWEKLTWNIPFNGLGVAGVAGYEAVVQGKIPQPFAAGNVLTTDILLADPKWENLLRELMREVVAVGNAKGLGIDPAIEEEQIARTRLMGSYKASTLLDFELRRPLELESMFFEPLRQAKSAGVRTPRLEALCNVLKAIEEVFYQGQIASR